MKAHAWIAALAAFSLIAGTSASMASEEASPFAGRARVGDKELRLRGTGTIHYLYFIEVSRGGLYLPPEVPSERALSDVPKRLEMRYFRSISAEELARMTEDWIAANVSEEEFERLRPKIARFNELYQSVDSGDRYTLSYLPGRGTELALNGRVKGLVEGTGFASALFSIWLGENPVSEDFRRAVLGRS